LLRALASTSPSCLKFCLALHARFLAARAHAHSSRGLKDEKNLAPTTGAGGPTPANARTRRLPPCPGRLSPCSLPVAGFCLISDLARASVPSLIGFISLDRRACTCAWYHSTEYWGGLEKRHCRVKAILLAASGRNGQDTDDTTKLYNGAHKNARIMMLFQWWILDR
jgi:hypothetical protein